MSRLVSAVILMTLSLLAIIGNIGYLPNVLPSVPQAKAVAPGNPALVGLWNNTVKSNAYINTNVPQNQVLVIDVNVTNAGPLNEAHIGLNWTGTSSPGLQVTKVSWDATNGLTGGIFDCISVGCTDTRLPGSQESTTFLQENLQDDHLTTTTGTGIIMRIRFQVLATGSYTLHLNVANDPHGGSGSILLTSGGPVAYQTIDGYFSDVSTPDNYSVSTSQKTVSVLRTVTGTNLTLPIATITFTLISG